MSNFNYSNLSEVSLRDFSLYIQAHAHAQPQAREGTCDVLAVPDTIALDSDVPQVYDRSAFGEGTPPRIGRKIALLYRELAIAEEAVLNERVPGIVAYAERTMLHTSNAIGPDFETAEQDTRQLQFICDAENARNPDLHLNYIDKVLERDDCNRITLRELDHIVNKEPGRYRFILMPSAGTPAHHVMLDIRKRASDGALSAVVFDALGHDGYCEPLEHAFSRAGIPVISVHNGVQKSNVDCVMFALAHALKAKSSAFVEDLHERICVGEEFERVDPSDQADDALFRSEDNTISRCENQHWVSYDRVPAEFKKHIQAKSSLSLLGDKQRERVNSNKHKRAESLSERLNAHYTESIDEMGKRIAANTSINGFRLQEITRTIRHAMRPYR